MLDEQAVPLAGKLYNAYCEKVGGVSFDGIKLPSWDEFRLDNSKQKQTAAWVHVAQVAQSLFVSKEER